MVVANCEGVRLCFKEGTQIWVRDLLVRARKVCGVTGMERVVVTRGTVFFVGATYPDAFSVDGRVCGEWRFLVGVFGVLYGQVERAGGRWRHTAPDQLQFG